MALGLILAGAQLGFGAYQYFKGQSEQKNLVRPTYQIPTEIKANLTQAQLAALEGLPEAQKKAYVSQVQQAAGAANNRVSDLKGGLEGIAGTYQNQVNAYQNLLGQDAMARQANMQQLNQARGVMAQYKDKAFDANQMQPYKQAFNQAQAMQGAGLQNAMGALQQGAGSLDQANAQKMQLEYLKTLNGGQPGATGSVSPFAQVGKAYGSLAQGTLEGSNYMATPNATVNTYQQQMNQWDVNQFNAQNPYIERMPTINPFITR